MWQIGKVNTYITLTDGFIHLWNILTFTKLMMYMMNGLSLLLLSTPLIFTAVLIINVNAFQIIKQTKILTSRHQHQRLLQLQQYHPKIKVKISPTELHAIKKNMSLITTLNKPSNSLAVLVEVVSADASGRSCNSDDYILDVQRRSMQLRKLGITGLVTSCSDAMTQALVTEQQNAIGNFPGPCPVLLSNDDDDHSVDGITAKIIDTCRNCEGNVDTLVVVKSIDDIPESGNAFVVDVVETDDASIQRIKVILTNLPGSAGSDDDDDDDDDDDIESVILLRLQSMQDNNAEVQILQQLRPYITGVILANAIVCDNEDLEYIEYIQTSFMKKKSSTFNMSGLTGSTNGHFGGVATSTSQIKTWLRTGTATST